jgi:perosamine synthetase
MVGGVPVRRTRLPYGHQTIQDDDVAAVVETLRSDWLTTGPKVAEFEKRFASEVGAGNAVAFSSGTAALHAAMFALGVGPGDEVIVPAQTFVATANAAVYQGGTPVFADVRPENLLIDPGDVRRKITPRTKAIIAVDYAGHPCSYEELLRFARSKGIALVSDACHALGASYQGRKIGGVADLTCFSFHPVKHITTCEGGMTTTSDPALYARLCRFRNHGITTDARRRQEKDSWDYEMIDLGFNYRLSDLQCALGLSQLGKLPAWLHRRRSIAASYDGAFRGNALLRPLQTTPDVEHARHLYVIELDIEGIVTDRSTVIRALWAEGIGVNVHYAPVYLHPYYRRRFGFVPGLCPVTERASERIVSLPIFPGMSDADVADVVEAVRKVLGHYARA